MTQPPEPQADPKQTEATLKKWFNEVLDERETKAAADQVEADKKAKEEADKARTKGPGGFLDSLIGKLG